MDEPVNQTNPSDDEVHLLDYLIILAKHSRMIIYTSVAVTVLTYLILFILPNKYTSMARLLPPQQNLTLSAQILDNLGGGVTPGIGGGGSGLGGVAAGLLGLKSPGDLFVGILNGDTIADRVIERFNLRELYGKKYIEDVRTKLEDRASLTSGKEGLIVIEVTDEDRQRSANMANVFIEELDALLRKMAISEAKQRLTFLEKERLQVSQNLSKAEETLRIFSEKNSVLQIDVQTRGVIEYVAKLRADIDSKEVAIQVMRQQATPFNYDVVRMETEVKGLREKLRNAETQYDNRVTDVCLPTNKTPGLVLEYIRLYREAKFQEALYQLYIKLVEIARMDLVRDHAVIQVVDYAKPPEKRSNKRVLPTLMVGAGSFFLLILVSFGREFLQYLKGNEEQASRIFTLTEYLKPWTKLPARIKNRLLFRRKS